MPQPSDSVVWRPVRPTDFDVALIFCSEFGHDFPYVPFHEELTYWYDQYEFKYYAVKKLSKTCSRCCSEFQTVGKKYEISEKELVAMQPPYYKQFVYLLGLSGPEHTDT